MYVELDKYKFINNSINIINAVFFFCSMNLQTVMMKVSIVKELPCK